jgi:hypothetical protein
MIINYLIVVFIKVYRAYQDRHVVHVFQDNEVIVASQVHRVFQVKKENQ